jgi:hypothetical protein
MRPRYASIGAVLISHKVAKGIRDNSGLWKHGHTYQESSIALGPFVFGLKILSILGPPNGLRCFPCRPKGHRLRKSPG